MAELDMSVRVLEQADGPAAVDVINAAAARYAELVLRAAASDAGPGHEWLRARLREGGVPVLGGMDRVGPALRAVLGAD